MLVVRRHLVAQASEGRIGLIGKLLFQCCYFVHQAIDLFLLTKNGVVELVEQIVREARFDFELGQSSFCVGRGSHGGIIT